jgi:hypothetical protein
MEEIKMKLHKPICLATSFLVLHPPVVNAGCGVACSNAYVAPAFIATQYAVPVGVPVANPYAATYSYTPQQPVNVTVNLNPDEIAQRVVSVLMQQANPQQQPTPAAADNGQPPAPPTQSALKRTPVPPQQADPFAEPPPAPVPSGAVAANCVKCHSPGGAGVAKINLTQLSALTCEQRLACARAILSTKMPKNRKLNPDEAGKTLEEIVGVQ